jgi:hypothetical protein
MQRAIIRFLLFCGIAILPVGCSSGSAEKSPTREWDVSDDLTEVGYMIRSYVASSNGKGPKTIQDLAKFSLEGARGFESLKAGKIVVVWGGTIAGEGGEGGSEKVLAYEKDAATSGGFVLFENGKVKKLSASEFQAVVPK